MGVDAQFERPVLESLHSSPLLSPAVRHALGCVVPPEFLTVPSSKFMLRAPTRAPLILPLPWLNETTFSLCKHHSLCEASMLGKGSLE